MTQIADADRNRPSALRDAHAEDPNQQAFKEALKAGIEKHGMPTAELADIVFDAIREERYWILPHPEYKEDLKIRIDTILNDTTPQFKAQLDY